MHTARMPRAAGLRGPLPLTFVVLLAANFVCGGAGPGSRHPKAGTPPAVEASGESTVAATPDVGEITADPYPRLQRDRHLARLGVASWHQSGQRGRGVKIAVLDSGFRGYRQHLGRALPTNVKVQSFRLDGNLEAKDSQHGILCAEVLHALAPEAELLLANWEPDRCDRFLAAANWARQQGARILTCSVIMPSWSDGEGNGAVHQELARILGSEALLFASAGNIAQRHWKGTYRTGPDGWHEWQPGRSENLLTPWGNERVSVEVNWQPGSRYAVSVYDNLTGSGVPASPHPAEGHPHGVVVRFLPEPGHTYGVRVRLLDGKPGPFHLIALGSKLQHSTTAGSIPFPGDGAAVLAVGAVGSDGQRLSYSSCGPNSRSPKPDLVALVPFASLWRPRPFAGTSAAAPQAAALAALLWGQHAHWTAGQVREGLQRAARDLGPKGHDAETGHGLAVLPVP